MSAPNKRVAVVGAGIIGACSAAYLQRDGYEVTIFDRNEPGSQTSYGNAGSLSPSAILPVSMPGMIRNVPAWLLDREGPLRLRWWYAPVALPWLAKFLKFGRPDEVRRIARALSSLLGGVFDAYEPLVAEAGLKHLIRRSGCLYVYDSEADARKAQFAADVRRENGTVLNPIGADELHQMEPSLSRRFQYALHAPDNGSTLDPQALTNGLAQHVIDRGGQYVKLDVRQVIPHETDIEIVTERGIHRFGHVVIAAGAWSNRLARQLGDAVPLETQRGYHATVVNPNVAPSRTVMWPARNLMTNPMAVGLRFAGTVEFAGLNAAPDMGRAEALLALGRQLYPDLQPVETRFWMGHRPCLPDSLPVIGRSPGDRRIIYAFGHQHVGMCSGAPTGRLVGDLVAGRDDRIDLTPFRVDRFRRTSASSQG